MTTPVNVAAVSTTYVASSGREQLDQVQAELYDHLLADPGGRCQTCREIEPCTARGTLNARHLEQDHLGLRQPAASAAGTDQPPGYEAQWLPWMV
jgi:hypothetical protein